MLELAILIPFVLWSYNEVQKGRLMNEQQNLSIQSLHHEIIELRTTYSHHQETTELRLESMSNLVDKIWSKLE